MKNNNRKPFQKNSFCWFSRFFMYWEIKMNLFGLSFILYFLSLWQEKFSALFSARIYQFFNFRLISCLDFVGAFLAHFSADCSYTFHTFFIKNNNILEIVVKLLHFEWNSSYQLPVCVTKWTRKMIFLIKILFTIIFLLWGSSQEEMI